MNLHRSPVPDQLIDKLNPLLLKLIRELENVQEVEFGEDYTAFIYKGLEIRITITARQRS